MYMYQAEKIPEFEEERIRILRDIITSQVARNYDAIQEAYGFAQEEDADLLPPAPKPRRDTENPYLVERRKPRAEEPPRRRKTDAASPLRGKW